MNHLVSSRDMTFWLTRPVPVPFFCRSFVLPDFPRFPQPFVIHHESSPLFPWHVFFIGKGRYEIFSRGEELPDGHPEIGVRGREKTRETDCHRPFPVRSDRARNPVLGELCPEHRNSRHRWGGGEILSNVVYEGSSGGGPLP